MANAAGIDKIRVAVCCNVFHCIAVCCNVLQCVAASHDSTLVARAAVMD